MSDESANPPSEFEPILRTLWKHEVEFVLIGGRAEQMMGSPRMTHDSDICYRRTGANLERLVAALRELDAKLRLPHGQTIQLDLHPQSLKNGLNFTFTTRVGDLDTLGEVEPIGKFDELLQTAEVYDVQGREVQTISLDDLIRVKRHINRPKDQDSLYQLLAIKRLREQGRA